jgi:hypothetical protein
VGLLFRGERTQTFASARSAEQASGVYIAVAVESELCKSYSKQRINEVIGSWDIHGYYSSDFNME